MRLLRLKVFNIASLRGEHEIDFESIQNESSLFAITGETGSGKSSILNSIGLSLYGQLYKKNLNQIDLITIGEKEALIQLIFQLKGQHYLAEWRARVQKQDGGVLKQPIIQRNIQELQGNKFNSPRGNLVPEVEGLLNLNFDQFTKCIILNQGEFARFLTSSFTERKEILEKLYPGDILDSLGRELQNELKAIQSDINEINTQLQAHKEELVNEDELKKMKDELKEKLHLHHSWLEKTESLFSHFSSLTFYHERFNENKKKTDLIKSELQIQTTKLNNSLVSSQGARESLEIVQKKQETELPKLQEFLKIETTIKLQEENEAIFLKQISQLNSQLEKTKKNQIELNNKKEEWAQDHQRQRESFTYPIDKLKENQESLNTFIDLSQKLEILESQINSINEKLSSLQTEGTELSSEEIKITEKIKQLPLNPLDEINELFKTKKLINDSLEARAKAEAKIQDISSRISELSSQMEVFSQEIERGNIELAMLQQELQSIEINLGLNDLKDSIQICLKHAKEENLDHCPVCDTSIDPNKWNDLLSSVGTLNTENLKARSIKLKELISTLLAEIKLKETQLNLTQEQLLNYHREKLSLEKITYKSTDELKSIETKIDLIKKQDWEKNSLTQEILKVTEKLNRARAQYREAKEQSLKLSKTLSENKEKILALNLNFQGTTPEDIDKKTISLIQEDLRRLNSFTFSESQGEKLLQELKHLEEIIQKDQHQTQRATEEKNRIGLFLNEQRSILKTQLAGKNARELMESLAREIKEKESLYQMAEKELKATELELKHLQSRLYELDVSLKENELLFTKELHLIKENAQIALSPISEPLSQLFITLSKINLKQDSPVELFIPVKDQLKEEAHQLKEKSNTLRSELAAVNTRLQEWEKKKDKIQLLELRRKDLQLILDKKERLSLVLGKDELRTFVLSLVEENLINQTNVELQKLCQGRYEIIHQSKGMRMTPEFYVLDKFRNGGIRKVTTLSGGETFMVSVAMALGLAEMTRGQAEIDSLFIDEGFGTLDQESLEDVLDMLHQIQNQGLMVGIISHIKALTNSLPVNLTLSKKQDGTSTIALNYN